MPSGNFSAGSVQFNQTEGGFTGTGNISAVVLTQRAPATPTNGPPIPYVYVNSAGTFKLSPASVAGAAQYTWQGVVNNDVLNFIAFGTVTDNSGIGVSNGAQVDVWLYQASDSAGNVWYLAFGLDKLNLQTQTPLYPIYYSYANPTVGGNIKRWLTPSGTQRI